MPAVQLAHELRTQWRTACPMGGGVVYLGLDYAAREAVMRALDLPLAGPAARTLLSHFRVVELEMTTIQNSRVARA